MWEAVFMLLVLKIPLVYLGFVVWWAIRAEPRPEEPAALVPAVLDTPPGGVPPVPLGPSLKRRRSDGIRTGPGRRPPRGRLANVRAESRR